MMNAALARLSSAVYEKGGRFFVLRRLSGPLVASCLSGGADEATYLTYPVPKQNKQICLFACFLYLCDMDRINAYKGIAPGKIIAACLQDGNMTQRELADIIGEHYQTLNAIIRGKRMISIPLSLKLDDALHFEHGFFAIIQTYYLLRQEKQNKTKSETHPKIRRVVFWDIDMSTLDWTLNKDFIINRVRERGNAEEINSVNEYYGVY